MSHRIIISSSIVNVDSSGNATTPEIEYSVTYSPSHNMTPAQVGQRVSKILRLCEKLSDPDEE